MVKMHTVIAQRDSRDIYIGSYMHEETAKHAANNVSAFNSKFTYKETTCVPATSIGTKTMQELPEIFPVVVRVHKLHKIK